jgi:glycosyltransferase involved in cell wall biosynthesis
MAKRGHRIVLLTPTLGDSESALTPEELAKRIATHAWAKPLVLSCRPVPHRLLGLVRRGRLPRTASKVITLYQMLVHGGVNEDWVKASRYHWEVLASNLHPDVVWATFGHSSNLVLGKRLARFSGCRWVADIKDNLDVFIPRALHPVLRRRLSGCSAVTANATSHAAIAKRFFRSDCSVVYSGVSKELLAAEAEYCEPDIFRVLLVGSVYRSATLEEFLSTLGRWRSSLPPAKAAKVELHYAGADQEQALSCGRAAGVEGILKPHGYLPLDRLAALGKSAALNCYIWADFTYHHKLLELLSLGVPVLAYPGESPEARAIATEVDVELLVPPTPSALVDTVETIYGRWRSGARPRVSPKIALLSWNVQAEKLEMALGRALVN